MESKTWFFKISNEVANLTILQVSLYLNGTIIWPDTQLELIKFKKRFQINLWSTAEDRCFLQNSAFNCLFCV